MRYLAPLLLLALSGCPETATNAPGSQTAAPKASMVILLKYRTDAGCNAEQDRLNKMLGQGWRVVSTETVSQPIHLADGIEKDMASVVERDKYTGFAEWNVTVVLER